MQIHAIGILLLICYVGWTVYKRIRPVEKGYTAYIKRGAQFETYFRYQKAFETYEKARRLPHLTHSQQATLDFSSGQCLLKLKKFKLAVPYFDRVFKQEAHLFLYKRQLKLILKGYMLAEEREKARELYEKIKPLTGSRRLSKWEKTLPLLGADQESN